MSKKMNQQEEPDVQIESAINKSEQFIEKNSKKMLLALCIAVLAMGGYFGYTHLISAPKEAKAVEAIYQAEQQFAKGEYALALNGDDNFDGFLSVANDFSGTSAGNIANHYAGICKLKSGDYKGAISEFEKYKKVTTKEAGMINAQNRGLIGDAYLQLNDKASAMKYYQLAVEESDNELTAPYFLFKLGGLYKAEGNKAKALECYETIKNKYISSIQARDIDKYIGTLK